MKKTKKTKKQKTLKRNLCNQSVFWLSFVCLFVCLFVVVVVMVSNKRGKPLSQINRNTQNIGQEANEKLTFSRSLSILLSSVT